MTEELRQIWHAGPANGNADFLFVDGESYLFAITLADGGLHIDQVHAQFDSESPVHFLDNDGESWDSYSLADVEWITKVSIFTFFVGVHEFLRAIDKGR
jgi:hypothetical protein